MGDDRPLVLIADEVAEVAADLDGDRVWVTVEDLPAAGWRMKPEGLCRGATCLPVALHPGLVDDELRLGQRPCGRAGSAAPQRQQR